MFILPSNWLTRSRTPCSPKCPCATPGRVCGSKTHPLSLIGKGGETIRGICEKTGARIDIEEEGDFGVVSIFATSGDMMAMAKAEVNAVTAEAEPGKIYEGTVTGIKEFGAFVEILPGKDGLCHISELSDKRVRAVEDVCKVGDKMKVKCLGVDDRGRIKLSRRAAMEEADAQA